MKKKKNNPDENIKVEWVIIFKESKMTEFMQSCDVFEKFKILGKNLNFNTILHVSDPKIFKETLMLKLLASIHQKNKSEDVVFAHIKYIQQGNKIILNRRYKPYIKGGVTMVSNGHNFYLLRDFIDNLIKGTNIKYEVNEYNQPIRSNIYQHVIS